MRNFYIDLDSILDTRLAVISRIDEELVPKLVQNDYHHRKTDDFEGVDMEQFRDIYNRYEVETLERSVVTNIFDFLMTQILEITTDELTKDLNNGKNPKLVVNVWPYQLDEEDRTSIMEAVKVSIHNEVEVEVIYLDTKELPPHVATGHYYMMVVYDLQKYLIPHVNAIVENPAPHLLLVTPMLLHPNNKEEMEQIEDYISKGIHVIGIMEMLYRDKLDLKFIDVELFSIKYPDDRIMRRCASVNSVPSESETQGRFHSQVNDPAQQDHTEASDRQANVAQNGNTIH